MKDWKKEALSLAFSTTLSWRAIAKKLGKSKSTVSDLLRKAKDENYLHSPILRSNAKDTLKFLFIDIETSPLLSYHWGLFNQNISINQIVEDWNMICYSYLWLGDDDSQVTNESLHNYPLPPSGRYKDNEEIIIRKAWKLLDDANFICGWNLKRFDRKKINAKFLEYGLPEPSPYKVVDAMLIAKGNFALTSNKLDYVTKLLGNEGKKSTDMSLWIRCMDNDVKALDYMASYCNTDVLELKDTYLKLRHWDKNAPNMALLYDDNKPRCNGCGSDDLSPLENKSFHTTLSKFSILRCNGCGKILRDRKNTLSKEKRDSLLMNA